MPRDTRRLFLYLFILLGFKKSCFSQTHDPEAIARCRVHREFYDRCNRHCICHSDRRSVVCCRLRREFTVLTDTDRRRYINTVKIASTHPTYRSKYETLIASHKRFFFTKIHELDFFLPWHRWFLLQYENILQEIDCRVTVPYWDWSLVGAKPFTSDLWRDAANGFGGNGVGNRNCVQTGPFRQGKWSLLADAGGGCLRRNFTSRAPDAVAVRNLLLTNSRASQFTNFELLLRREFHDPIHCLIGGTMCSLDSAASPEFFLHHGFVDKIWREWQKQSRDHMFTSYFTGQARRMPYARVFSKDVLDLNNQTGSICAEYVEPSNNTFETIKELSKSEIKRIPRLPLVDRSRDTERLFHTTLTEQLKEKRLKPTIAPERTLSASSLFGHDAIQGFRTTDLRRVLDSRRSRRPIIPRPVHRVQHVIEQIHHIPYFHHEGGDDDDD